MKNRIIKGESIFLSNGSDIVTLFKGHQNRFCLMLNGLVIKSTKTWNPIKNKLQSIGGLNESI